MFIIGFICGVIKNAVNFALLLVVECYVLPFKLTYLYYETTV